LIVKVKANTSGLTSLASTQISDKGTPVVITYSINWSMCVFRGFCDTAAIELDVIYYRWVQRIGVLPSLVVVPGNAEVVSPLLKAQHLSPHTNCTRQSACDECSVHNNSC